MWNSIAMDVFLEFKQQLKEYEFYGLDYEKDSPSS